jgi:2-iminobutanoate/2-iminopropanoate deaminase
MAHKVINTEKAPAAIGPYVQAVNAGNMLFASGQLGLNPETGTLPEGIEAQTRQCLANVAAILEEAGFVKEEIVKTTVFIDNMDNFGTVNGIYAGFFGDSKPARSCVEVAKLPKGGLVEIEFVAVKA